MPLCVKSPVKSHGITDCFGMERSLRIIQFQPPTPSTSPGAEALFLAVTKLLNLFPVFGSISNANRELGYSAPVSGLGTERWVSKIPQHL